MKQKQDKIRNSNLWRSHYQASESEKKEKS
jgi:hypothetical protein